ncbi:chemotaxis protein CheW [Patescibacteria group bacterium]|nr:chemotaxis protein CheW [Patescibacteria group bacterium]
MIKKSSKFVLFSLADYTYALPLATVAKFVEFDSFCAIPGADKNIKGLIYYEGKIITIFDSAKLLGLSIKYPDKLQTLLFSHQDKSYGLLVSEALETVKSAQIFVDKKKKQFKKYIKIKDNKIYILEPEEIIQILNIND